MTKVVKSLLVKFFYLIKKLTLRDYKLCYLIIRIHVIYTGSVYFNTSCILVCPLCKILLKLSASKLYFKVIARKSSFCTIIASLILVIDTCKNPHILM